MPRLPNVFAVGGSSLTSVFQNPIVFFCVCAGPPSVLRFYTESTGSPLEQSVITPTQKPQPDHQSAATAAAAAMVRHEICFEGTIFTWGRCEQGR